MGVARRPDDPASPRRRPERLEARLTVEQKALIEHAAALEGRSMTDFVLASVQEAARRSIVEHQTLRLGVADSRRFVEALLEPRAPDPDMRRRVARFRALMGD